MFDIGFPELMIVAIVALLVLGPERLPEVLRTMGLWFGRLRRSFGAVKAEIEQEIGMDEIRRQLHNEAILEEMKRIESDVQHSIKPETSQHSEAGAADAPETETPDPEAADPEAPNSEATANNTEDTAPKPANVRSDNP